MLFVGHLVDTKRQSQTVRSYISAIRNVLRDEGVILQEDNFLLNSLMRACRLCNDKVHTRLPIQKGMLSVLIKFIRVAFNERGQSYLATLYSTMLSTAYYGLFRVSELTKDKHNVLARNVQIAKNKKKLLFMLRSSKTHGEESPPQIIKISSSSHQQIGAKKAERQVNDQSLHFCPYQLLNDYRELRGPYLTVNEPFFVLQDHLPVTQNMIRTCLKLTIRQCNFNESLFSMHFLRSGRTHDLLKMGLSVETIKKIGCWRSNAVFRYLG